MCFLNALYKLKPNENRDVIFLNFLEPSILSNDSHGIVDNVTVIYRPKTTWTVARNMLLEFAIERQVADSKNSYEYYVFLDEDVAGSTVRLTDALDIFEKYLLEKKPAVGYG